MLTLYSVFSPRKNQLGGNTFTRYLVTFQNCTTYLTVALPILFSKDERIWRINSSKFVRDEFNVKFLPAFTSNNVRFGCSMSCDRECDK